ncbi:MAG: MBL fold metallo-hydrolase, partial [Planctomycetes bacterium]|nr:MBL fold metallo-hydrolase [Planctomycetota bacterium]
LDPTFPTMTVCNSAYRSSMGLGILERNGFKDLYNMAGGSEAWIAAGLPLYGAEIPASGPKTAAQQPQRAVRLADRISTEELKRLLLDLPGSFDLIDIRPPQHFADYHLPASKNVEIAELLDNPAYLTGAGPLIIVDRDGSLAMMVAGIISQKTQRTVKALYGGLSAYWTESTLGATGTAADTGLPLSPPVQGGPMPPAGPAQPAPSAQPQPDQPKPPAKKSAGC